MKVFKNLRYKLQSLLLKKLFISGFELLRAQDSDVEIEKLQSIKNPKTRLLAAEQLVSKNSKNPKVHFEFVKCLHKVSDIRQFENMNIYSQKLMEWLSQTELEALRNIEFIQPGTVTGAFGNHYTIEVLLRANKYGLRPKKKLFMLLPENEKLRNPALFSYFEPYINVVRDSGNIHAMKRLESMLTLPLGLGLPINEICPYIDLAANMAEVERIKLGMDRSLFHLNEKHYDMGKRALKKLGLPGDAWYVTIHVRESGYRGEGWSQINDWKSANPLDYINACKAITKAGGWVFRMGDPSMTNLPKIPQVIDYANMEIRSDWMDIFLGATCRFLIGTASGYQRVPGYFGVPTILTNCTLSVPYFSLFENDLYLPRLLKQKVNGKYLSFEEFMSPPISMLDTSQRFLKEGLEWIENTPEELEAATIEMLEKTEGNNSIGSDDELQNRFKIIAEKCDEKYGGHLVKAFAPVSREFLHKHSNLLE